MAEPSQDKLITELKQHYEMWTEDNNRRLTRKNGWNDITDAYWGILPTDWPYLTKITDPRIRTTLIEKNARLLNTKLRGRLVPREGSDSLSAMINNSILEFQWDIANEGGSMMTKLSICDMDARLYQSKFVLTKWRYEKDSEGNCTFDSNDAVPLDIRDCGLDPSAKHIRGAKWFQHRSWEYIEDLENQKDTTGKAMYKNIGQLKTKLEEKLSTNSNSSTRPEYTPRGLTIRGLTDRTGEDKAFPVVKIVTEYREDRWITFTPDYDIVLRDIPNPYKHGKIPVAQLRYYPVQDDPLGESEVESVLPLWRAIQATVCSYMDEVILKMRPPLKIIENAARIETIVYGPEAQWLVDREDAVTEMRSGGDSLQYFQTTYQALVSAFNTAMGDLSQGISNFGPFESGNKTATEVRATAKQQNSRDQKNQNDLGEFIKDIMMMWQSNNKQFLFSDPEKSEYIIRIVGQDQFDYYKRAGLDAVDVPSEAMQMISDIIEQSPDMTDAEIQVLMETASVPRHPVVLNPNEKDLTKLEVKPKMKISEYGNDAEISVVPDDLEGYYDYIPDVKSMAVGAGEELSQARTQAIAMFTSQPVLQLLMQDGYRPNIKELIISNLEGIGLNDAERFIQKIEQPQAGSSQMGGASPIGGELGLQGVPPTNTPVGVQQ